MQLKANSSSLSSSISNIITFDVFALTTLRRLKELTICIDAELYLGYSFRYYEVNKLHTRTSHPLMLEQKKQQYKLYLKLPSMPGEVDQTERRYCEG